MRLPERDDTSSPGPNHTDTVMVMRPGPGQGPGWSNGDNNAIASSSTSTGASSVQFRFVRRTIDCGVSSPSPTLPSMVCELSRKRRRRAVVSSRSAPAFVPVPVRLDLISDPSPSYRPLPLPLPQLDIHFASPSSVAPAPAPAHTLALAPQPALAVASSSTHRHSPLHRTINMPPILPSPLRLRGGGHARKSHPKEQRHANNRIRKHGSSSSGAGSGANRLPGPSNRKLRSAHPDILTDLDKLAAEERAVKEEISRLGLSLRDVEGDGNCLFRALSDQLYGDQSHHPDLRRWVCDWIMEHKEEMEFWVQVCTDGEQFEAYVERMRKHGEYDKYRCPSWFIVGSLVADKCFRTVC